MPVDASPGAGDAGLDPDMCVHFSGNVRLTEVAYGPDDDLLSAMRDCADAEFPSPVSDAG